MKLTPFSYNFKDLSIDTKYPDPSWKIFFQWIYTNHKSHVFDLKKAEIRGSTEKSHPWSHQSPLGCTHQCTHMQTWCFRFPRSTNGHVSRDLTNQLVPSLTQRSAAILHLMTSSWEVMSAQRSCFKKFIKIHWIWILRKFWYILGQDVLLHHYIKSGKNLIILNLFLILKFLWNFK